MHLQVARPRDEVVDEKEPKKEIPRVVLDENDPTKVPVPKPPIEPEPKAPESAVEVPPGLPLNPPVATPDEPPMVMSQTLATSLCVWV